MTGILKYVKLRYSGGDDGELSLEFRNGLFSGGSSIWLNHRDLREFAEKIENMQNSGTGPACLSGGYWNSDATILTQEHAYLEVTTVGLLGKYKLVLRVAEPQYEMASSASNFFAGVEFVGFMGLLSDLACAIRKILDSDENIEIYFPETLAG